MPLVAGCEVTCQATFAVPLIAEVGVRRNYAVVERKGEKRPYPYCAASQEIVFIPRRHTNIGAHGHPSVFPFLHGAFGSKNNISNSMCRSRIRKSLLALGIICGP